MADRGVAVNVIYAGTLEHYQGIDLLLQSMVSVIGADARIGLIVAGGSPQQIAQYRDMARGLGLDDRYIFVGRVPQKTAKALCARADVLLSPRTRGMNTPLKVYEQLASGKPLVATRIPSHTQVLTDDVAFLADPEPAAFARQILRAATDTRAVAQKVSEALKLYETAYSSAVYADKIDRLLARIS
jgi:glycosyltransferase involved in cell wall biosynthesis